MPRFRNRNATETFIRFVVGTENQPAERLDGLFVECRVLRDDGWLEPYQVDWLERIYTWFNAELPCPPFSKGRFPVDAVSWFRSSATPFIARMWDLSALLRDHGCPVRLLKTDKPGAIMYEDSYQVVASPWRIRR
jgi:hypothetical protein